MTYRPKDLQAFDAKMDEIKKARRDRALARQLDRERSPTPKPPKDEPLPKQPKHVMKFLAAIAVLAMTAPAVAQQQQVTPSQMALQIQGIIGQWAQQIEADQRTIADLQKQIAELKAKTPEPKK